MPGEKQCYHGVSPEAVSYTHLDVYKRQTPSWEASTPITSAAPPLAALRAKAPVWVKPVSYTHLDVYKRQKPARSAQRAAGTA